VPKPCLRLVHCPPSEDLARPTTTAWGRWGLALLLAAAVAFGGVVEFRSAFLHRRMGDLEVFLRAGWAVRAGADIYAIIDSKGFHYHYPPLFAILMAPLADPPPGQQGWYVPYAVSVGVWYALSVLCLVPAVHWLASALEETSPDPAVRSQPRGCPRWWLLRLLPLLTCLPAVASSLARGQVSVLLLLLLCGMAAALLRRRPWQAGLWLAGAVCLKVIPAFLVLYPLYRRDWRCLAGCAAGLVVGLGVIPAAVFGPARTLSYYREWTRVLVRPALGTGTDRSRARELIDVTATESQSFQAILHNTLHLERYTRPPQAAPWVVRTHWLLGAGLTGMTLLLGWRRPEGDAPASVLTFGALVVLMNLLSPVCHLHYFCLSLPLAMGLVAASWERNGARLGTAAALALAVNGLANTVPHLPGCELLRDTGLAMYGTMVLWLAGSVAVWLRGGLPWAVSRPALRLAA
jgi:alpha-1,2-mannosyltransferase